MGSSTCFSPHMLFPFKLLPMNSVVFWPLKHSKTRRLTRGRSSFCALEGKLEASWIQLDGSSDDDSYGGWSLHSVDAPTRDGFPRLVLSGVSAVAILLAGLAFCSCSRKCFTLKLSAPLGIFHDILGPSQISKETVDVSPSIHEVQVESTEEMCSGLKQDNEFRASVENKRIVVPVPADPAQLKSIYALKKLKIIDYEASADKLCTRREFARWLIKANSMLERKTEHRINPMCLIPGSIVPAFDDVNTDDPDFWCIQALAEAGIVSSRLSSSSFTSLSVIAKSKDDDRFYFFPDNYIFRIDLLNWRALLEYPVFSELEEEMSRTWLCMSDLKLDVSPQLLTDLMSGDGSIVRKTFGNIRSLQPEKPVTMAQAAVSLTSGRMAEAICTELSRLEAEELSKLAEMEEIRVELIRQGVTKCWEEKLSEEKKHALQVDSYLEGALFDLELERAAQEEKFAEYMKDRADLECQQQILFTFKKEIDEMREKLDRERGVSMAEKQMVESRLRDSCEERDAVFEAKSVVEAEKEAFRIHRSWVEEEARKLQARADVLERAVQRWRVVDGTAFSEQ